MFACSIPILPLLLLAFSLSTYACLTPETCSRIVFLILSPGKSGSVSTITPLVCCACCITSKVYVSIALPFVSIVSQSTALFTRSVSSLPSTTINSFIFIN